MIARINLNVLSNKFQFLSMVNYTSVKHIKSPNNVVGDIIVIAQKCQQSTYK